MLLIINPIHFSRGVLFLHIILFCCLTNSLFAQATSYYKNYTTKDGLPSNELYWLTQSMDGRLWVGSDAGLVAYDGLYFKTYTNAAARNASINGIVIDHKDRIWCYNFANQLFCLKNDSLHLIHTWENTIKKGALDRIHLIDSNRLYLSIYQKDAYIYHIKEDSLVQDSLSQSPSASSLLWVHEKKRLFWHSTLNKDKLCILHDGQTPQYIECSPCHKLTNRSDHAVRKYILENSPIGILVYARAYHTAAVDKHTPFFFLYNEQEILPLYFPEGIAQYNSEELQIINTHWEGDSILWLATSKGVFSWDINKHQSKHYFKDKFISDIYIDREQNIWGTSLRQGLFFLPSKDVLLHPISTTDKGGIQSLSEDHLGNLLIGHSNNQLSYLDGHHHNILYQGQLPSKRMIDAIHFDPMDQFFWIIQDYSFLSYFIPAQQTIKISDIPSMAIKQMAFDSANNVFCALGQGASIFSKNQPKENLPDLKAFEAFDLDTISIYQKSTYSKKKSFYCIDPTRINKVCINSTPSRSYSIALLNASKPSIWIGFSNGLHYNTDGTLIHYPAPNGAPIIAKDLLAVNDSTLWAATHNTGLFLIQNKQIIDHITEQDGLPSNKIYTIKQYKDYLWIGTQNGLARYHPTTKQLIHWNSIKGLTINKVQDIACVQDRIYITDGQQLLSTSIHTAPLASPPPLIEITAFSANGKNQTIAPNIRLAAHENSIQIHFRGISLKSQGSFSYLYRLVGSEKNWIKTSAHNHIIRYPNLSPGNYQFEVTVIDAMGVQNPKPALIHFSIAPAFYNTWIFWILCFGIGITSLWVIFKRQMRKIEWANQQRETQNQLVIAHSKLERDLRIAQLKALKAQMNPHFIFNVLNSIQGLYITNNKKKANLLLSQFSQLIRLTLDMSEELEVSLEEEIKLLKLYLEVEHTRVNQGFDYELNIDPLLHDKEIYLPSLLVQPYIENALKHGLLHKKGIKTLKIDFQLIANETILNIIIDDNGIGRKMSQQQRSAQHRSFSTSANSKRLELLNSGKESPIKFEFIDKTNDNGAALGSTVVLQIPL